MAHLENPEPQDYTSENAGEENFRTAVLNAWNLDQWDEDSGHWVSAVELLDKVRHLPGTSNPGWSQMVLWLRRLAWVEGLREETRGSAPNQLVGYYGVTAK